MTAAAIAFTGAEGNRLAGEVHDGHGQPVLFLHGGGQTRHAWTETARRVAASGMRAIAVDLRGHGGSEWVASGRYSIDDFAADTAAIVTEIADRFHALPAVVGASLGGLSALQAHVARGTAMGSLVLVDVTPRMNVDGVARITGFMGDRMAEGFASLEEAADAVARYLPNRKRPPSHGGLRKNLRLCEDGRYRWHWDPAFIAGEFGVDHRGGEILGALEAELGRVDLPVLLVRGMQSELIDEEHARRFVEATPSASYVDVAGAGHMVAGDRNDVFCAAILDFLADRRAA